MKLIVNRYGFNKKLISAGQLMVEEKDHSTIITYIDDYINITACGIHHPIKALENLRKKIGN